VDLAGLMKVVCESLMEISLNKKVIDNLLFVVAQQNLLVWINTASKILETVHIEGCSPIMTIICVRLLTTSIKSPKTIKMNISASNLNNFVLKHLQKCQIYITENNFQIPNPHPYWSSSNCWLFVRMLVELLTIHVVCKTSSSLSSSWII